MKEKLINREYAKHQCDKCKDYVKCPFLQVFLKFWHNNKKFHDFVSDGCDLAKACWKFEAEKVLGKTK